MKNSTSKLLLYFFLISVVFGSCTFEKRVYRPGYRIEWRKNKSFSDDASQVKEQKQQEFDEQEKKQQQQLNVEQNKSTTLNLETFSDVDTLAELSLEQEQQENNSQYNSIKKEKINKEENLQEIVPLEKKVVVKDIQGISDSGGSNKGLYMILLSLLLFG